MDEQHLPLSEPFITPQADDEISDAELDEVAGGLARIWMGQGVVVAGREERSTTSART